MPAARVVLTEAQLRKVHPGVIFNENLHDRLTAWVGRHYRESLSPNDLADPSLLNESQAALDELMQLLGLDQPHTRR